MIFKYLPSLLSMI